MKPRVRLTVVDAGPFSLDRSDLMAGASGPLIVPSTVPVIEHQRHGLVLVDTGVNYRVADAEQAEAHWGPGLRERYGATGSSVRTRSTRSWNGSGTGAPT